MADNIRRPVPISFVGCCPFFLVILVSLVCCMAFARGWWRLIEWLYGIVKVFIAGLCPVFTEHKPTCCDTILVTLVCNWGLWLVKLAHWTSLCDYKEVHRWFLFWKHNWLLPSFMGCDEIQDLRCGKLRPSVTSAGANQTACFKSF